MKSRTVLIHVEVVSNLPIAELKKKIDAGLQRKFEDKFTLDVKQITAQVAQAPKEDEG